MRPPADANVLTDRHKSNPSHQINSTLGNTKHNCPKATITIHTQIHTKTNQIQFSIIFHHSQKNNNPSYQNTAIRKYNTQTDNHESPIRQTKLKQFGSIQTTSARRRLRFEPIQTDPYSQTKRVKLSNMVRRSRKINDPIAEKWRPAGANYANTCTTITKNPKKI
jgi:hypothetical protein